MRFFRIICSVLLILIISSNGIGIVFANEVSDTVSSEIQDDTSGYSINGTNSYLGSTKQIENATSAFLYEYESDTLMYAWNPDLRVSPSSLVKILTALIAVENGNLDTIVCVDNKTLSEVPFDAVSVNLVADEQITLHDLLMCMMVGSGNDAAAVIATHISGSQEAFVDEMNRYAQSIGCVDTQFTNVHGLHDENQYSTARDLARILSEAVKNESFMTFFSTVYYTVPATNKSESRSLDSSNFLMNNSDMEIYYDSRVTGGRTGISGDGTRCLAATAEQNGLHVLCVITGAESTFDDSGNTTVYGSFKEASALFDTVFNGYKRACVFYPGQILTQFSVSNGRNDVILGVQDAVSVILPTDTTSDDLQYRYLQPQTLQAPVNKGDILFPVEVWHGNVCLMKINLYAMNDVPSSLDTALDQSDDARLPGIGAVIVLVIIAVIVLTAISFMGIRRWRKIRVKKRSRRYRIERKRSH